jgi:hypothetical protein
MMFGFLKSAVKAAAVVVDLPLGIATDIVTLRGLVTDKDESYTGDACRRFAENVKDMADPDK